MHEGHVEDVRDRLRALAGVVVQKRKEKGEELAVEVDTSICLLGVINFLSEVGY